MVIQGIIRPPPEIRAVADRTALYVAKNGRAFEARILNSGKGKTPKFAFLHATSPFHAYYEQRVQFYEAGGEDEKEKPKETKQEGTKEVPKEDARKKEKAKRASASDPIAKALLTQRTRIADFRAAQKEESKDTPDINKTHPIGIPKPPPPQFVSIVAPSGLNVAQIETIQLVAQFTAMDGKSGSFLGHLRQREWTNPAFAFCQPRHGHFSYFSALVDAYRKVLDVWTTDMPKDGVKEFANNVDKCLEHCAYRSEYERDAAEQAAKEGGEVVNGASNVDWHDFVVVETIDFPIDEVVEMSIPPPPPAAPLLGANSAERKGTSNEDMEESDDDEEQIRVVPNYTPKVFAAGSATQESIIDPITGKSVLIKDMPEHMRIQLLDPKWAEERSLFQAKQKDSNLVGGDVVASNLERMAQARGKMEQERGEQDPAKRLAEANRVLRDQSSQVGPGLPSASGGINPVAHTDRARPAVTEPPAKRSKFEPNLPPPPPPPTPAAIVTIAPSLRQPTAAPPAPENPFAAAGTAPSGSTPKASTELLPAEEFAASLNKSEITLAVRIPNDPTQMAWNFFGQIVSVAMDIMGTVKQLKSELARVHLNGIPVNKFQLKNPSTGTFLSKDALTLAALNIGPNTTLELKPRTRAGRK